MPGDALVLDEPAWRARRQAHERRVDAWITPHLARRARGESHPVEDFLFTYYSSRPAALRRWRPGLGVVLTGPSVVEFAGSSDHVVTGDRALVDCTLDESRRRGVRRISRLLSATASRPPALSCFGLHEWAMVYARADERRHASYPLRLGSAGTDEVVGSHRLSCTHVDAFRFFTPEARPRNAGPVLTRDREADSEQPGCLHAAMDCYRWAFRLAPYTSSELVADCFALAREVRRVDMQASPYDLSALDLEPIAIETPAGKAAYVRAQRSFAERSAPLRARLIAVCRTVLGDE